MKVIELNGAIPSVNGLVETAQQEDVVFVRDGRPVARLERFDTEDWEDWQYECSPVAQERGRHAREQYARREYKSLEEVKERYGGKNRDQDP